MNWEPLNKDRTFDLFTEHAVLFGTWDGIPLSQAKQLLSPEAVAFAQRMGVDCIGKLTSEYTIGDHTEAYLTPDGFRIAVTYMNVKWCRTHRDAMPAHSPSNPAPCT